MSTSNSKSIPTFGEVEEYVANYMAYGWLTTTKSFTVDIVEDFSVSVVNMSVIFSDVLPEQCMIMFRATVFDSTTLNSGSVAMSPLFFVCNADLNKTTYVYDFTYIYNSSSNKYGIVNMVFKPLNIISSNKAMSITLYIKRGSGDSAFGDGGTIKIDPIIHM